MTPVEHITISSLEVILRFLSAATLTVAAVFLIIQLRRRIIRPAIAWEYAATILVITAAWRWFIVLLIRPDLIPEDTMNAVDGWILPIGQAIWFLLGIAVILIIVVSSRRRHSDG